MMQSAQECTEFNRFVSYSIYKRAITGKQNCELTKTTLSAQTQPVLVNLIDGTLVNINKTSQLRAVLFINVNLSQIVFSSVTI